PGAEASGGVGSRRKGIRLALLSATRSKMASRPAGSTVYEVSAGSSNDILSLSFRDASSRVDHAL
ncbi:MAG: hypothetical protein ACREA0_19740, partial [bacterium]